MRSRSCCRFLRAGASPAQTLQRGRCGALGDQRSHNGTKPTILTPEALTALRDRIKTPPDGGLWTRPKIARWLAKFHGVKAVHDQRGWDALIAIGYSIQQPRPRHPEAASDEIVLRSKKLVAAAEKEQRRHPDAAVEIWAMDEHRIGLKPIVRGVWAPVGERPIALGHHRFEWLYVTGFVEPASGRTVWNIANAVCEEMFELVLADFAESVGEGPTKRIVLQLDNAGWHRPENLAVPDGIRLVFQPAHSPELRRPNIFGPASTNRSPTAALPLSRDWITRSATVASHSPSSQTSSATAPYSTGGHVSVPGCNQLESV